VGPTARATNLRRVALPQRSGTAIASANSAVMRVASASTAGWRRGLSELVANGAPAGNARWIRFGAGEQRTRRRSQA
jgi:hypothetical protein